MWTCTPMRLVVSGLCPSEDSAACARACGAGSRKCGPTGHSAACEAVRGNEGGRVAIAVGEGRATDARRRAGGRLSAAHSCAGIATAASICPPRPSFNSHRASARTHARTLARTHARTDACTHAHARFHTADECAEAFVRAGGNAHDVPVRLRRRVVHAVRLEPRTAARPHPRLPASMDARLLRFAVGCCASHASRYGVRCTPYTALHARPRRAHVRRQGVADSTASVVEFEQERRERPLPACCNSTPCCTASLTGRARAS